VPTFSKQRDRAKHSEQAMSKNTTIEFVLRGKVDGLEITPRTIGLSQFKEFNRQVEEFIGGSQKLKLGEAHVEIPRTLMCCASFSHRRLWPASKRI
jgi:hypothetical protein